MEDWKYVLAREVNELTDELICFHTKLSFKEDILGYPLFYTINPKYLNNILYILYKIK